MDYKSEENRKKFIDNLRKVAEKFNIINGYIERGEDIPEEYTKNFITFPLVDDPYSSINNEEE